MPIKRGSALRLRPSDATSPPWERRQRVAEARILSAVRACSQTLVFTFYSALVIWGVPGWLNNPDVTFRASHRYTRTSLPPVRMVDVTIPGVPMRQTRCSPLDGQVARLGQILVDTLENTALMFACFAHPLEAFVAVCGILRKLADADTRSHRRYADLAEPIRQKLLEILDRATGLRGVRTARAVVRFASAQCESVGERAFLWVLLTVAPAMPVVQHHVVANGRDRWIDVAFPALKIAIEFDGAGKLGTTEEEIRRARRDMLRRDADLARLGWHVYHFTWEDLVDLEALRAQLVVMFGWNGVTVEPERRRLWRDVPPELTSRDRRF